MSDYQILTPNTEHSMNVMKNAAYPVVKKQIQQPKTNITSIDSATFTTIQGKKKKGLSNGTKWGIGISSTIALIIGALLLFFKGKHIKPLFKKTKQIKPLLKKGKKTSCSKMASLKNSTACPKVTGCSKTTGLTKTNGKATITEGTGAIINNSQNKISVEDMRKQIGEICLGDATAHKLPNNMYSNIGAKNYKKIRRCDPDYYQYRPTCSKTIQKITEKEGKGIHVMIDSGWHYRLANKNRGKNRVGVERISLNVYPEESLIKKLDDFIAGTNVHAEYKTPESYLEWTTRHDPITIYFMEKIPESVKDDIIKIASPHVRPTTSEVMLGKKLADGIYHLPEPSKKDVLPLIKRASKLGDDALMDYLKNPSQDGWAAKLLKKSSDGTIRVSTSPALVESVKMLLDDLEKIAFQQK